MVTQTSPKVPSRPLPAWLHSCCWERVKSPDAHQALPGAGPRYLHFRETPQMFRCAARYENHRSGPAHVPDKQNPAADCTPPGVESSATRRRPTNCTLARMLRSDEPSSQQPLPTGDIQVLEPHKRILSLPKVLKSGKTRFKSWLCLY